MPKRIGGDAMSSYAKRMFLDNEAKEVKLSDGAYDDEMATFMKLLPNA